MHILHITRDYPPLHKGGISTAVEGMTRALCARGLTVTVLSFDGWRPRTRRDGPAELALETLGSVEIARLSCPTQLKAAHGFVEARCPTHIHVHHDMLWDFAASTASATGARTLLTIHVLQRQMNLLRELDESTMSLRAQERAFEEADVILSPSPTTTRDTALLYPALKERLQTTPLGSDVSPSSHKRVEASRDVLNLLFVGRFDTIKGTHILFDTIEALAEQTPRLKWRIAGGIPDNPKAERRWKKQWENRAIQGVDVSFVGWLTPANLQDTYRDSDILVAPSLYETFGLSVLEAMGNGLAICASETGGLKDLLEHEQSALLSQPGQSDELASNINKLSNNPILRNTLGRSAHKTATSGFSWDVVVPALINAYDS